MSVGNVQEILGFLSLELLLIHAFNGCWHYGRPYILQINLVVFVNKLMILHRVHIRRML
jgi:hypothetical protein